MRHGETMISIDIEIHRDCHLLSTIYLPENKRDTASDVPNQMR